MNAVFILWHVHKFEDGDVDEKLLCVYRAEGEAKAARERVDATGFGESPDVFLMEEAP
jgi:hypothetical protein